MVPEIFLKEPLWWPVTLAPMNSILEFSEVIKYFSPATGDADEVLVASPTTAFGLSAAGLAQAERSNKAAIATRATRERSM
jgi:hypothetical protein